MDWLNRRISLSRGIRDAIQENILEIITNSHDHSGCDFGCYVCAQTYYNRREIEVSIMDFGVGIPSNLIPIYSHLQDDAEAVKYSLVEGVSSRTGKGAKGTGLNVLSQFISLNNGSMRILSSRGDYHLSGSDENIELMTLGFPGTCICLNINIDDKYYFFSDETEDLF